MGRETSNGQQKQGGRWVEGKQRALGHRRRGRAARVYSMPRGSPEYVCSGPSPPFMATLPALGFLIRVGYF